MSASFITIAQAVQLTGKSRRTIQRLVESLLKQQPDQVMKEKTPRGYIWKLSEQAVRQAFGAVAAPIGAVNPADRQSVPAPAVPSFQAEKYMEVTLQGYKGMMAMHHEVKQVYENWLKEKDGQIAELNQALARSRTPKGFWARIFGE